MSADNRNLIVAAGVAVATALGLTVLVKKSNRRKEQYKITNPNMKSLLYIDGKWVEPAEGKRIPVTNPATGAVIHHVCGATKPDVDRAVAAAKRSFEAGVWANKSGVERAAYLRRIADEIKARKDALGRLEAMDNGKPLPEALWDIDDVAGTFEYYAELAEKLDKRQGEAVEVPDAFKHQFKISLRHEPVGVVGCIIPWNYPMLMAAWKVAPALAAGCSIVLKPSEYTPLTALELADICHAAGLPAGVLNVVNGYGPDAGEPLCVHPDVEKLAFTGSTATGSRIMAHAARDIKNVTLELGGKSPIVVFDDVDVDKAVEWVMFGCFWTNGQICSSTSRLLVHENIAEIFLRRLKEETELLKIGDPLADGVKMGPIVSKPQYDRVRGFIKQAMDEGCEIITGGLERPRGVDPNGFFLRPTVVRATPRNTIWKEEVFGPVLAVTTFKTEPEAILLANDTCYGLGAAVISDDEGRRARLSKAFRAGIVWANCSQPCFCFAPWGGFKRSGIGRELGPYGLENYLEVKQITEWISKDPWGWYGIHERKLAAKL